LLGLRDAGWDNVDGAINYWLHGTYPVPLGGLILRNGNQIATYFGQKWAFYDVSIPLVGDLFKGKYDAYIDVNGVGFGLRDNDYYGIDGSSGKISSPLPGDWKTSAGYNTTFESEFVVCVFGTHKTGKYDTCRFY